MNGRWAIRGMMLDIRGQDLPVQAPMDSAQRFPMPPGPMLQGTRQTQSHQS